MTINLNTINPMGDEFLNFDDNKIENQVSSVSCYFRNIKNEIIEKINKADAIFGCVAWFGHKEIMDSLLEKENASIVMSHKSRLTKKHLKLVEKKNWIKLNHLEKKDNPFFSFLNMMGVGVEEPSYNDKINGIRKLIPKLTVAQSKSLDTNNVHFREIEEYEALMHNKFLVFAKVSFAKDVLQEAASSYYSNVFDANKMSPKEYIRLHCTPTISPYAVWTGSYNFTAHTDNHLENGVFISNSIIAEHYLNEFMQIYMLSRTIDSCECQ